MNRLVNIYGERPLRLYLFNVDKNKCTGKKRDYANMETFLKYGIDTFNRYNLEFDIFKRPTKTKAKLCFLSTDGKYTEIPNKLILENIS